MFKKQEDSVRQWAMHQELIRIRKSLEKLEAYMRKTEEASERNNDGE